MLRAERKLLVYGTEPSQLSRVTTTLSIAGVSDIVPESMSSNIINKLQDRAINGLVVIVDYDPAVELRLLNNLNNNSQAKFVPVVAVITNRNMVDEETLYDLGCIYVCDEKDLLSGMNIMESVLRKIDLYRVGNLARFTR